MLITEIRDTVATKVGTSLLRSLSALYFVSAFSPFQPLLYIVSAIPLEVENGCTNYLIVSRDNSRWKVKTQIIEHLQKVKLPLNWLNVNLLIDFPTYLFCSFVSSRFIPFRTHVLIKNISDAWMTLCERRRTAFRVCTFTVWRQESPFCLMMILNVHAGATFIPWLPQLHDRLVFSALVPR